MPSGDMGSSQGLWEGLSQKLLVKAGWGLDVGEEVGENVCGGVGGRG